jgi:hypothetical protein
MKKNEDLNTYIATHRIITDAGCWLWTGCKDKDGYGVATWYGRKISAHRLVAKFYLPDYKKSLLVLHKTICPNKACFNYEHLYMGNHSNNAEDARIVGTRFVPKTYCRWGHAYTEENTYYDNNYKRCKTCRNIKNSLRVRKWKQ